MGKKMKKLPFLPKIGTDSSWPWPTAYCHQPRTLSFRIGRENNGMKTTVNSAAYLDAPDANIDRNESWFTNSSESAGSFSTVSDDESGGRGGCNGGSDLTETMIQGLRSSERLFFEPEESNLIVDNKGGGGGADGGPFKESVVLSMESKDPYVDFKKSMEEMVEAHGLKDWEGLEELLCCYLRVNGKSNHGYILGAFVDLLAIAFNDSSSSSASSKSNYINSRINNNVVCSSSCSPPPQLLSFSPSSPLSFYTNSTTCSDDSCSTPCISSLAGEEEEIDNLCTACTTTTTPCLQV